MQIIMIYWKGRFYDSLVNSGENGILHVGAKHLQAKGFP